MRLEVMLMGILLVGVPLACAAMKEPESADHEWLDIRIEASFSEEGGVVIDKDFHDIGVSGPGDQVNWILACADCPAETEWRVTDLQLVVDLHALSETMIRLFTSGDKAFCLSREELGLKYPDPDMVPAREAFELVEPGWGAWAPASQPIVARSRRTRADEEDQQWKFAVEIRAPGYDPELPCEEDRLRDCWDPHKYTHPDY